MRAMVPRLMRKKVAWFRRVATADVTIYLSSDNYYWRWYRGYKIFNFLSSSLSSSPNLFHRFLFLFPFFLFFFSQLLASPTRWIMNPQDRWYNNFPAFLSCGYPGSSTPFRSEYYPSARLFPFQGKYTMSREKVSDRWSWRSSKRRENGFNCQMWRSFMDFWYY